MKFRLACFQNHTSSLIARYSYILQFLLNYHIRPDREALRGDKEAVFTKSINYDKIHSSTTMTIQINHHESLVTQPITNFIHTLILHFFLSWKE